MQKIIYGFVVLILVIGCENTNGPANNTITSSSGALYFSFDKANVPTGVKTLTTNLSRSGYTTLEKTINVVSDTSASMRFDQVAIGTWKVKIDAKSETGQILFTGESNVTVIENSISQVNLVLSPVSTGVGSVQINVTWGSSVNRLFPKAYGGNLRDFAMCVRQTLDGGYILGGLTNSIGLGGDAWLVKTNFKGEVLWSKNYGGSSEDCINDIVQTFDGGFLFVGYTKNSDEDSWLVKIDSLGNKLWEKKHSGLGNDAFLKIQKASSETYLICGYYSNEKFFEGRVVKVSITGDLLWSKTYGGNGGDFAMNILPLEDGSAIVIGNNGSVPGHSYDFWVFKISDGGDTLWHKTYGSTGDDRVAGICKTSDGNFLLSGYTTSYGNGTQDAWILCINQNGGQVWSKTYGEFGSDYLMRIESAPDNNYVAAGITTSYGNGQQGWLLKIDIFGSLIWSKTYGGVGTETIREHKFTKDGGIVFAGYTNYTESGYDDFWLGKVDMNGNLE